jgi:phytoene synthase
MNPVTQRSDMLACRAVLEENSKSFALAARLLPKSTRDEVACVYAFCRRVDDAIDDASPPEQTHALAKLVDELNAIYAGTAHEDAALRGFQAVAALRNLPQRYPRELLAGMAMDARGARYETLEDLLLYCHRVAGVVGLMMCHAFGLTQDAALLPAAHLGIAMQLTNICRDVAEDYGMGRRYLPRAWLRERGSPELDPHPGDALPDDPHAISAMQQVVGALLNEADRYYASAERGMLALPFRAGLAVRACDPRRGRAVVRTGRKLLLLSMAVVKHAALGLHFAYEHLRFPVRPPSRSLVFPEDVLA